MGSHVRGVVADGVGDGVGVGREGAHAELVLRGRGGGVGNGEGLEGADGLDAGSARAVEGRSAFCMPRDARDSMPVHEARPPLRAKPGVRVTPIPGTF